MKHPKKMFVSVLLAVAMVITCFLSFGSVSAAAVVRPFYESVYYFYDCYPTAKMAELDAYFATNSLIMDGQNVTEEEFYDLIDEGYFSGVALESLVIIDIKTFKPDQFELYNLCSYLHFLSCDIVLISTYTQAEFDVSSLGNYVDMYFEADFGQLEMFVRMSVDDLFFTFDNDITGMCFLIDGNMLGNSLSPHTIAAICEASPFLRLLLLELDQQLAMGYSNNPINISTYINILRDLYEDYNVTFLAHRTGNVYRNVRNLANIQASTVAGLQTSLAPSGTKFCAFGFWSLTSSFHDFLYAGQQSLGYNSLPVYVFEIESVENSTSGLVVNTDADMAWYYGDMYEDLYGEVCDERERFLAALLELMEELQ